MKSLAMLAAAATLLVATPAFSQTEDKPAVPTIPTTQIEPRKVATPLEFIATASSANAFEIEAAKVALKGGESPEVKAFAQKMIDDHTASQQELLALAKQEDNTNEFAQPAPDGEQQGMLAKFDSAKTGAELDKMYIESQIYVHQRAISLFKGYSEGDSELNRFAAKTLPGISMHYEMAVELGEKLNVQATPQ